MSVYREREEERDQLERDLDVVDAAAAILYVRLGDEDWHFAEAVIDRAKEKLTAEIAELNEYLSEMRQGAAS